MPQTLHHLWKAGGIVGLSRLQVSSHFQPQRIVTLTFAERVGVEVSGPGETPTEAGTVHYDNAPEWARSWDEFLRIARPLEACDNKMYDAIGYIHSMLDLECESSVKWLNPNGRENALQLIVIQGYAQLAEAAGLRRLIRLQR